MGFETAQRGRWPPTWRVTSHGIRCCLFQVVLLTFLHTRPSRALYDADVRIESARLYGNVNYYAYYFVDLLVGSPPQVVSVIVDTGSTIVGFPCSNCQHCGHHIDPPFDFQKSSSASWVGCTALAVCNNGCLQKRCSYSQSYTEGSSISGFWFQDYVHLGDFEQRNPAVRAQMGCHINENRLFYTQRANGILGMAPMHSSRSRSTILQDLFDDNAHVVSDVFSICLAIWGGKLTVGGYNASLHVQSSVLQWMPMTTAAYYSVNLQQIQLAGRDITSWSFGPTIVDSGTTYTYFPGAVYDSLVAALKNYCKSGLGCEANYDGKNCWKLREGVFYPDLFPPLVMHFVEDVKISWSPRAYLYQRDSSAWWCHSFADNGADQSTVLGASWMLLKDVIFDIHNGRLGVVEANCPEHRRENDSVFIADEETGTYQAMSQGPWLSIFNKRVPLLIPLLAIVIACLGAIALYQVCTIRRSVYESLGSNIGRGDSRSTRSPRR